MDGVEGRWRGAFVVDGRCLYGWGGCSGIVSKESSGAIGKFVGRVRRKDLQDLRLALVIDVSISFSKCLCDDEYREDKNEKKKKRTM